MRILCVREDRLGDVLLTLPAIQFLRNALPQAEIYFKLSPMVEEAIGPWMQTQRILRYENSILKSLDAVIFFNAAAVTYRRVFLGRVPVRFGIYSSLASYLFLNSGVRQKRSESAKAEGIYNAELAQAFLDRLGVSRIKNEFAFDYEPFEIPPDKESGVVAEEVLSRLNCGTRFLVLHPGMGGSALNLSPQNYRGLISHLKARYSLPILVSCGPAPLDAAMVKQLLAENPDLIEIPKVGIAVLRELFRRSQGVIAPSTGPLHLAHYVGTPTLGLFSPVRSHHVVRWRPWGSTGKTTVLAPEVECLGQRDCLGKRCPEYFCMEKTRWDLLLEKAGDFI